jgi:Xaa-Pro aminopeptidase
MKRMKHLAYSSIVAGGNRGSVLHYVNNDRLLKDGDLLLTDAGGEYMCYASDITRTIPVNGKFSQEQKEIYQIVLNAQKSVIDALKPGVKWVDMHILAEKIISDGLVELGLIKGNYQELVENDVPALFFPHGLGYGKIKLKVDIS